MAGHNYGATWPTTIEARETLAALVDHPIPDHGGPYYGLGAEIRHSGAVINLNQRWPFRT